MVSSDSTPLPVLSHSLPQVLSVRAEKVYGSSLLRVASCFEAVDASTRVYDLAALFRERQDLMVVGICSGDRALGLVSRVHLFNLLGKPFGLEVLGKRTAAEVIEAVPVFDRNANLFAAAESIHETMDRTTLSYYLLTDTVGRFQGIFSSKDILAYLSRITQEDIALAGQLQERLVKGRLTEAGPGWQIEAFSQSAQGLGGDFYHVVPLEGGRVFVAVGDVSGKGAAASVLTSMLWGVLQFFDYRQGLSRLLVQLNEALIRTFHLEKYLTGVFFLYDPADRTLTMADMGHGHGWIIRQGRARALRFPGPSGASGMNLPLGIDLDLRPQVQRVKLAEGDLVCLYTDGLTEQEDDTGAEFGEGRVVRMACHHPRPADLPEALLDALGAHQGAIPRLDDVTWLQLKVD